MLSARSGYRVKLERHATKSRFDGRVNSLLEKFRQLAAQWAAIERLPLRQTQ
jgi:hypothetical protein